MHFHKSTSGLLVPESASGRGHYSVEVFDCSGKMIQRSRSSNIWTNEFMNYALNAMFGASAISAAYIAPFSGDTTPVAAWTGASFTADSTETTAYSEPTRVEWTHVAAASQVKSNSAAPAEFTISSSGINIYGFGLLQAVAKSATTGLLISASRLAAPLLNMQTGYKVRVQIDLGLQNPA